MTLRFEISQPLREYADALKAWGGKPEVRAYARRLDSGPAGPHLDPDDARQLRERLLAVAPPPASPGGFDDPAPVRTAVLIEAASYSDGMFSTGMLGAGSGMESGGGLLGYVVEALGTEEQKEHWKRVLSQPGVQTAFALTEPGFGSDTSRVATTAVRDGETWVINGTKMYCSGGGTADYLAVFANIDKSLGAGGIKAFVVPATTPGFKVLKHNEDKLGIRNAVTSELGFEDCTVPVDHMLGWSPDPGSAAPARMPSGRSGALGALSRNRPNITAAGAGTAQAAVDLARQVLAERRPSYSTERWTKIQNELDNMDAAIERVRLVVLNAQWRSSEKLPNRLESSTAKAFGPPTFERIIRRCMQYVGHSGTSHNYLFEKWYRDIKIQDIFEGSGQIQRIIIGREIFGRDPDHA
jgi:acyl-CoA dehydrogenase